MKMRETVLKLMKYKMKIAFWSLYLYIYKTNCQQAKNICDGGGGGKTGSGATANKMAVAL